LGTKIDDGGENCGAGERNKTYTLRIRNRVGVTVAKLFGKKRGRACVRRMGGG